MKRIFKKSWVQVSLSKMQTVSEIHKHSTSFTVTEELPYRRPGYTPGLAWLPRPQSIHPAQSPFLYKVKGLVPSSSVAFLPSNQCQGLLIIAFVSPSFEAWFPGLRILKDPWSYSSLILPLLPWRLISPFSSSKLPVLPDATTAELTVKI